MLRFVKPTEQLIEQIAADMRQADADEVWASHRHTPMQALMKGLELSDFSTVVMHDDTPLVMLGLVKRDILTDTGVVWLLGTNESLNHRKAFLKETKPVIDEMLSVCSRLCNMVHAKNIVSIQWLRRIGFTIDEPVPAGPDGELFHYFHLERG